MVDTTMVIYYSIIVFTILRVNNIVKKGSKVYES